MTPTPTRRGGVKGALGRCLRRLRGQALTPVLAQLEATTAAVTDLSARIDGLSERVGALEAVVATIQARTASVTERQFAYDDDRLRLDRRLDSIEKLLADG